MNKYYCKERDYAEVIIKNGFTSKYIGTELKTLAKYYKSEGRNEEEIKNLLQEFCEKKMKGYNEAVHYKLINNAVNYCLSPKNKLIQIDSVQVSSSELKYIEELDLPHEHRRVIFTLLVLTKLSREYLKLRDGELKSEDFYFGGHKKFRELVSTSKITFNKKKNSTVKNIHDLIHILHEKGIVEIANSGNIRLCFMYEIDDTGDCEIEVSDYSVVGYYYDLYYGENKVKQCDECGVPVKINGRNQKYCPSCSQEINRKKNKERVDKYRNK